MPFPENTVTSKSIIDAHKRILPIIKNTPLIRAEKLEEMYDGAQIYLKLENLQHTSSFKIRGVANKMLSLNDEELKRGVTAASSGNHAQAVAYMAARLGTKATIIMPENAPATKINGVMGYGAKVILHGFTGEDRDNKCDELMKIHGYSLVHSHTDPFIIEGHATVVLEIAKQMCRANDINLAVNLSNVYSDENSNHVYSVESLSDNILDEIIFPCGAGSLASGGALISKYLMPSTLITAVEPAAVPRFTQSLKAGKPVTVEMGQTFADGLRVSKAEPINYELIRDYVDRLITVEENSIYQGVRQMALSSKIVAEPSACVGLAAALEGKIDMSAGRKVCFVITGGNMDSQILADVLRRET